MPYEITQYDLLSPHQWKIAFVKCDLSDENDVLIEKTIDLVRRSYGEGKVIADAESLLATEIASGTFDLEHLKAAIREGLPDPKKEGDKPKQLTNYRSQSAEMIAKSALAKAYGFEYPAAPQEGTLNPNQPILGFDGWGILKDGTEEISIALIQVKATDSNSSPPSDAEKLAVECQKVPRDRSALCRALTVLTIQLHGDPLQPLVMRMLEKIGKMESIPIIISPVVVRGRTDAKVTDFDPIKLIANSILPTPIHAIAVSIGTSLEEFGYIVMSRARGNV